MATEFWGGEADASGIDQVEKLLAEGRRLQADIAHRHDGLDWSRYEAWCVFAHTRLHTFLNIAEAYLYALRAK